MRFSRVLLLPGMAAGAANAAAPFSLPSFRAPAIPLLTTDPFMQTWMRGDTSTSDGVTHWDGQAKTTTVLLRLGAGGGNFQLLGVCVPVRPATPGPSTDLGSGHNISPGSQDISNLEVTGADDCNRACYGTANCQACVRACVRACECRHSVLCPKSHCSSTRLCCCNLARSDS